MTLFHSHLELLQLFLAHRDEVVERLQALLNAQRQPVGYLTDGTLLPRHVEDCFFTLPALSQDQSRLRRQLEDARRANGLEPRAIAGLNNGLADPAEMMVRAFHLWRQTRWPGRNGRVHYAHTLFNLCVVRHLTLLSLRLWDDAPEDAGGRLAQMQGVLDALWAGTPENQPVLVRDARWLIPLAQSPATDDLGAYFDLAERVATTLPEVDRIEIHRAGVVMAGGHLRSQIRHFSLKRAVPFDDPSLVSGTRTSNALDLGLLIQDLVPLLEAYERAWQDGDHQTRLSLAGAICQGVSLDPALFLSQVALLAAYSMIEHSFVATDGEGRAAYTHMGERHLRLVRDYQTRIGRVAAPLHQDCARLRPVAGAYSPYGAIYGFSSDLLEHMAFKALQPGAETRFGLEHVFADEGAATDRLAWVNGWRKLPHIPQEVQTLYDYPQQFAADVFDRMEQALRTRAAEEAANTVAGTGRLFLLPADDPDAKSRLEQIPDLPVRYVGSTDRGLVAARQAEFWDEPRLMSDRQEGKCLVSYRTPGGWVALSKAILTEVLGAGRDAKIAGLPPAAVEVLLLMCPGLVVSSTREA